mmetsp:Transcript_30815/g.71011  ORF Transcript_30815/g.71011 Transcript_30815/m.71011 type:complete len:179 (-) Transcript_30815:392-928(-)|eukprot:CAMPEP_0116841798 /NCGR_PEP_ID=MMETSP0418-20121206/11153_1 /TAXON_ID=1158023 /ORGANISM="Astrosyne radiata, Strain 13vi08-1A" /LENGTH=178 /DNA_ID=CAMNT_0004472321 /DNA_START=229 /DNA_END=765 /DNA_ORIENTATION=-
MTGHLLRTSSIRSSFEDDKEQNNMSLSQLFETTVAELDKQARQRKSRNPFSLCYKGRDSVVDTHSSSTPETLVEDPVRDPAKEKLHTKLRKVFQGRRDQPKQRHFRRKSLGESSAIMRTGSNSTRGCSYANLDIADQEQMRRKHYHGRSFGAAPRAVANVMRKGMMKNRFNKRYQILE